MTLAALSRVLMTADAVGGVWTYALQLSQLLIAKGVEVVLATMGPPPSAEQRHDARLIGVDLRVSTLRLEWMPDCQDDLESAGFWLLDLERELSPEIVHLNGYIHAALPWHAPVMVVAHSCVASWWAAVHGSTMPPEWTRYVEGVRRGLREAKVIVAPSRAMRDALVRFYDAAHNATIIPNCRTGQNWHAGAKEPFVLAAGRAWDAAKNIATLDAAAAGLPWPVRLAGDTAGPLTGNQTLHHIEPLGRKSATEVAALMARAGIYVLPARYEPFGLSVLEAALSGCPLVLGDIDSLRENWDGAARFTPPNDATALRNAVAELIDCPAQRERLGQAARDRAQSFSPERHLEAYCRVYENMVSQNDRTADPAWAR